MPGLLPFDINQLKASLHLLLHLFSSALRTVSSACPLFHSSAIQVSLSLFASSKIFLQLFLLITMIHENHNTVL